MAEIRIPSPPLIRPIMGFSRLSAAAYDRLRRAVDDDDEFRARVAEAADEAVVGKAGVLWLTRPDGWETDPVFVEAPTPPSGRKRKDPGTADAKLARVRAQADKADEARKRAVEQKAAVAAELQRAGDELAVLRTRVQELEADRNTAVRTQKKLEADLAAARRDLRLAREAAREAEAEVLELQASVPATAPRPTPPAEPAVDVPAIRAALHAAAEATRALDEALQVAADAVGAPAVPGGSGTPATKDSASGRRSTGRPDRRRRPRRMPPALPPGVFADSAEAHRHLVSDPDLLVVVDGYNLARAAWTGLAPEEERRRTVALLEETSTRSGASIVVVFDGDDATVAPAASRVVRVRFSPTGVTADDDIAALLAQLPTEQTVLVVSTDREVADDARTQGAAVLSSAEFLVAVGR